MRIVGARVVDLEDGEEVRVLLESGFEPIVEGNPQ